MKWVEYNLDELIHIKHGYAFKGEFFSDEPTDDILLTPGNFAIGGGFKAQKLKYYNGDFPVDYILDENDVIVTMTDLSKEADTLGFSAKVPAWSGKRFLHNQRIGLVKLKTDDFDQDYLYWLMRTFSYQRFVANGATGATVKHTSPTKICQYKFTAPEDKNTQRKIASILSAYDDSIENNLKRIKLLEEKALCEYRLINRFVTTKLLADILKLNYGKSLRADNRKPGIYPVYGSSGVVGFNESFLLKGPGVIVGRKGNVGTVFWSHSDFFPIDTVYYVESEISLYFLYFNLKHSQHFDNSDAAVPGLNRTSALSNKIHLPSMETIKAFEEYCKPIFSLMNTLQKQNTKLREARDILLPRLMNGQIEV
jgi:type I restriction enzyme, S subunit